MLSLQQIASIRRRCQQFLTAFFLLFLSIHLSFAMPRFSTVRIVGAIDIELIRTNGPAHVEIFGPKAGLQASTEPGVFTEVKDHVLSVCATRDCRYRPPQRVLIPGVHGVQYLPSPKVKLWVNHLSRIEYAGRGCVALQKFEDAKTQLSLQSYGPIQVDAHDSYIKTLQAGGEEDITVNNLLGDKLKIIHQGHGRLNVNGHYDLRRLIFTGRGCVVLQGLESCRLEVHGWDQAKAFLFGNAQSVYINLHQESFVDAKKLHAQRVYARTHDSTRADVWANKSLDAQARDYSDIRYYHRAKFLGEHVYNGAAILNMVELDPYCKDRVPMYAYSEKWHGDCYEVPCIRDHDSSQELRDDFGVNMIK